LEVQKLKLECTKITAAQQSTPTRQPPHWKGINMTKKQQGKTTQERSVSGGSSATQEKVNAIAMAVFPKEAEYARDLTLTRLVARYPWMFSEPHITIEMPQAWTSVFEAPCAGIGLYLGEHPHGFYWTRLTHEGTILSGIGASGRRWTCVWGWCANSLESSSAS
jgi:hypothetical protein